MIEIYAGGNTCYESTLDINTLYVIMTDDYIKPDTFLEIPLIDETIAFIKKQAITSFNSLTETAN